MPVEKVSKPKRRRIVELRLDGMSARQIADVVGLSEAAIRKCLAAPEVKAELEDLRSTRLEQTRIALERSSIQAVAALAGAAAQKHESKAAIAAADSILDRIGIPRKQQIENRTTTGPSFDAFAARSAEDCEYYAEHGHWPEEAPR